MIKCPCADNIFTPWVTQFDICYCPEGYKDADTFILASTQQQVAVGLDDVSFWKYETYDVPHRFAKEPKMRTYPPIDYSRCTPLGFVSAIICFIDTTIQYAKKHQLAYTPHGGDFHRYL
ncbi:MAG: hypothetical protein AB7V24_16745 [Steroidobacteraceae bacterium]